MKLNEVLENLCFKDQRNPLFQDLYGVDISDGDPPPIPGVNCYCDNCHYGRDKLAVEILKLYESVSEP